MPTNSFNNEVRITKMATEVMRNSCAFAKTVNTEHKSEFEGSRTKQGVDVLIRVPGFQDVRTGSAAQPGGYNDTTVPLTLTQYGVDLAFTSKDLQFMVENGEAFKRNVLEPMIVPLANKIDSLGLALYNQVYNSVGTPGTSPSDLAYFLDAGALLDNFSCPRDARYATVSPKTNAKVVYGNRALFNKSSEIDSQYEKGIIDTGAGFKWQMDQNVKTHVVGTFGTSTPLMDGTTADGATTINVNGWASGASTLNAGDIISIDGVYALNPVSKEATNELMQFRITTTTADSSGAMATLPISPAIILTGPTRNVSALPVNDAKVYVYGKNDNTYSAKRSITDLLYHRNAFTLACIDMAVPDSVYWGTKVKADGLPFSFRMVKTYNGNSDEELLRLDVMVGWALVRPEWAARVQG